MATIKDNIAAIRQAIYGKDVRAAIADSIEQFDDKTEGIDALIDERIGAIDEKLSNMVSEETTGIIITL